MRNSVDLNTPIKNNELFKIEARGVNGKCRIAEDNFFGFFLVVETLKMLRCVFRSFWYVQVNAIYIFFFFFSHPVGLAAGTACFAVESLSFSSRHDQDATI
jgi:hypothetical protein